MFEPRICIKCALVVERIGSAAGDTSHRAFCTRKVDANGEPVACESERFAVADEKAGVCGSEGIFWAKKD